MVNQVAKDSELCLCPQQQVIRAKDEDYIPLSIYVGSWNMGNQPPPPKLSPWLPREGYDIVAVGVQNCQVPARLRCCSMSSVLPPAS